MHTAKPQARTAEIIVRELSDETLVYDLKNHQAHCLNRTASLVWQSCDGKRSTAEIARLLAKQTRGPAAEEVVWLALRQLSANHLLAENPTPPAAMRGVSRRQMARKLGLGAAVALPLVTSIIAPTAVEAQTILTLRCVCGPGPMDGQCFTIPNSPCNSGVGHTECFTRCGGSVSVATSCSSC